MAETVLGKTGLTVQASEDLDWEVKLNDGLSRLEERIGLVSTGDPNGQKQGHWFGQSCFDVQNAIMYECVRPGPTAGTSRALWEPCSYVPVGTIGTFLRQNPPPGWLGFGGTYQKALYPRLVAVLPPAVTQTTTTFTLGGTTDVVGPNSLGQITIFRDEVNVANVGRVFGHFNISPLGIIGSDVQPFYDAVLMDVRLAVKF